MLYRDRTGKEWTTNSNQDKVLNWLYCTGIGRTCLKVLVKPWISKLGGCLLDTGLSRLWIKSFVEKAGIDMSQYEERRFKSYNDFFTRKIKPEKRPVDMDETHFVSPCDSKLTVHPIGDDSRFLIKGTEYTMESLLRDESLAEEYKGGTVLLFRLSVDDYHRYCYPVSGTKTDDVALKGFFHTVNPLANDVYPIYKENTRKFSMIYDKIFGKVLMMEVGALMVGKIVNYDVEGSVKRGEEKGRFEFGGSTIIVCLKADTITVDEDILENSKAGIETKVRYGEKIGVAIHSKLELSTGNRHNLR